MPSRKVAGVLNHAPGTGLVLRLIGRGIIQSQTIVPMLSSAFGLTFKRGRWSMEGAGGPTLRLFRRGSLGTWVRGRSTRRR